MLKTLFSVRLGALKGWITGSARTQKAQSKGKLIGFTLLMLYALAALGFMFWHILDTIAVPFHMAGLDWLYFAMTALMEFALMFIGSVFTAKAQLYEARDNDLLLSMPIKPSHILLSRIFMLWVIAFVFGMVPAVPGLLVWLGMGAFSGAGLAAYLLLFVLLLPLFAVAVAALFGWLLSVISGWFGNKSLVTVLLSLVFLGLYMYWAFRMNALISTLAQNPEGVAGALGAVAPLYWAGLAAADGDLAALLKMALIMLCAVVLVYFALEKTFLKVATNKRGAAKKKYVEREEKAATPRQALFRRELSRFLSSPAYMLNCGLGAFMALLGAAVLLIKKNALLSLPVYSMFAPFLQFMLIVGMCFCAATILITAPSVSLESKNLWIAQSLPVSTRELFRAKLRLHNCIALPPVLLASAVCAAVMRPELPLLICQIVVPAVFCVFTGLLGLFENLRHPNFDWTNETQAVKSGVSVLFTMLITWGLLLIPVLIYIFFGAVIPPVLIIFGFLAVIVAVSFLLYRWIMNRGCQIYASF